MLLDGLHIPLTTLFFADGRLNLRKLEQNVARYSLTPAAGMLVLGETGEAELLSDAETVAVLRAAVGAASATKVMLAGVLREGVGETLRLIEEAGALGYDAAVVRQPLTAWLTVAERRLYFEAVLDRSPLPVVMLGPVETLAALALHRNALGAVGDFEAGELRRLLQATTAVKRTVTVTAVFAAVTGRMVAAQGGAGGLVSAEGLAGGGMVATLTPPALKTRTKVVGFQVLARSAGRMLEGLSAGAVGAVPGFAAAGPQVCHEVLAAWKDGDPGLAAEKQERLMQVAERIEGRLGVAGLKFGCDLNGYFGGVPRLPRLPLNGAARVEVQEWMADLKA